jgi:anti-sigma factor RsiW
MTCEQTNQVHRYHDGDLSPEQQAALEAHLQVCAECRDLLADLRELSETLLAVPLPEVPQETVNRMQSSFWIARDSRDRSVRLLAEWLTAAAAIVLALVPLSSPSPKPEAADRMKPWVEVVAIAPPLTPGNSEHSNLVQVAQWMASDLSLNESQ